VALLVAERPHAALSGSRLHRLPYVTFRENSCAYWLAQQLEDAGIEENELYWINGYDAHGVATDASFIYDLQPRVVVTLGKLAERWCADNSIRSVAAANPQSWMKFHKGTAFPLTALK
jgi:hypothetical protein